MSTRREAHGIQSARWWFLFVPLIGVGAVGYSWCYSNHICMAGHMQHPPYPSWHHTCDMLWATTWLISAFILLISRKRLRIVLGVTLLALLAYRFPVGSLGGLTPLPI